MTLQFVHSGDPILRQNATEVSLEELSSSAFQNLVDQMIEFAASRIATQSLAGLAAPQVGIPKRVILVDTHRENHFPVWDFVTGYCHEVFVNPHIVWSSKQEEIGQEGCFSTEQIRGIVPRTKEIIVRSFNCLGNVVEKRWSGYTARIFQHEMDHLDGIRFPDRVTDEGYLHWVEKDEIPAYCMRYAYWKRLCPRSTWEAIKTGKPYRIPAGNP